jgi:Leucine-rich repeat (LRR) protein
MVLGLSENLIKNIEVVRDLKDINVLYLNSNRIHDITPLAFLEKLQMVDLRYNMIDEPSAVKSVLNNNGDLYKAVTEDDLPVGVHGNIYVSGNPVVDNLSA